MQLKKKGYYFKYKKYHEAANYSIDKEKLAISSSFFDFIIFIIWLSFGLKFLDAQLNIDNPILKAVLFINLFIIINWFLSLPFSLYQTFKLDKNMVFQI